jgi:hypothetical protein
MPLSQLAQLCLEFVFATSAATALSGTVCYKAAWRPWHLHAWLVAHPAWRQHIATHAAAHPHLTLAAEGAALTALAAAVISPAALLITWAALLFDRVTPPQYGALRGTGMRACDHAFCVLLSRACILCFIICCLAAR